MTDWTEKALERALSGEGSWRVARALGLPRQRVEKLFARLRRAGVLPPRRPDDKGGALPRVPRAVVLRTLAEEGYPAQRGALRRAAARLGYTPSWLSQRLSEEREYGEES